MAENTKIQWTDYTLNPWAGCQKVAGHQGCAFCYAEVDFSVLLRGIKWGKYGTRVKLSEAGMRAPLKWDVQAAAAGERRRVFCASLSDVFEDWDGPILHHGGERMIYRGPVIGFVADTLESSPVVGQRDMTMDDCRRELFGLIDRTPNLDWQLLTKRPENIRRMWTEPYRRKNVWLGTSVSDQKTADRAITDLLKCRDLAPVLFISVEPLLSHVNLEPFLQYPPLKDAPGLDWVIVGGESGYRARTCNVNWIREIIDQCKDAEVSCFVKQLGSACHLDVDDSQIIRDKKGGEMDEWPEGLRVREFPVVT